MNKLIVQLSKTGDVIGLLPMAKILSDKGVRVGIMACKPFSDVLDGVSYVEKVVFDGQSWEIEKAVTLAKTLCKDVVVTMTNGKKEDIQKFAYDVAGQTGAVTDSFARESWKLAGMLPDWGRYPLVFDKRNAEREAQYLPKGKKKTILYATKCESSPFPYGELLVELLRLKYPKCNLVDLSAIKAERIYDLLGLFESAHCLVTVDTAHLHLAAAVPSLPVMALIQDTPLYWHGTAWRPQHHFHCRYKDFPRRALELFEAIEDFQLTKRVDPMIVQPAPVKANGNDNWFFIQDGSCHRDAVNSVGDNTHFPMLRNVIIMALMKATSPAQAIILTANGTKLEIGKLAWPTEPSYAYRMIRKDGKDTFFPVVDLFAGTVDFWRKIFPLIPDVVMATDGFWSRILLEIFKMNNAVEIGGVYRNAN